SVSSLVADAHRHGAPIEGVDVQRSAWETTVVDLDPVASAAAKGLQLGLDLVRGLRKRDGEGVVAERDRGGDYRSVAELARRCKLDRAALGALAMAGALRRLTAGRREAVWQTMALGGDDLVANLESDDASVRFSPLPPADELRLDVVHAGSFIEHHPLELYRPQLRRRGVLRAIDLARADPGSPVKVAGLVIVRQRPSGGKMIFMALEDETGLIDLAVKSPVFARFRPVIMLAEVIYVEGVLQRDGQARSVVAHTFQNLSDRTDLSDHPGGVRSRDFH
ncbi:MAG: error-prone DNA polymerase, partial [Deltaproteobacteria bacterium]|nr:error-prone DNA polymerase [Deltaproteobacteria bacterium]